MARINEMRALRKIWKSLKILENMLREIRIRTIPTNPAILPK